MLPRSPTTFRNVLVLRRAESGWFCEIDDRSIFVELRRIAPGTTVPGEGHRGAVSVTAEGADEVRRALAARAPSVRRP